ncbi:MAG: arginine--tRNA ligase [Patescibacteria group bacterium]|jgi:arginyl-tRNA synthetase
MSYSWDAILKNVAHVLSDAAKVEIDVRDLVTPPDDKLGDLAFGCFKLAKAKGKSPADIAKEIAAAVGTGDHSIASATAAGPYVNITLQTGDLIDRVVKDVEAMENFGAVEDGTGKHVMLEYAQPNTHKEIHVGHFRNLILGSSLALILKSASWDTVTASYHGDVGAHVAKCLWLFVRKGASHAKVAAPKKKKKDPVVAPVSPDVLAEETLKNLTENAVADMLKAVSKEDKTGKYLGALYAEASKVLEENPDWKTEVSEVQKKLEAGDKAWSTLWQETRRWSLVEIDRIFQELGVAIDRKYLESEVVNEGQKIVDELIKKGIARESQGAIIVDLEEQKLGVFLIRKSDGTSLYATKDLALAKLKLKEYPKLDRSLMLVDNRQSLYFKQLFATLKLMGLTQSMEFVGYEFVTLKSGAMSSREGNIVTLQDFRDEVLAYATKTTQERHADWTDGKVAHTAWCLTMGGIKFGMLRQDSDKIYVFDVQQALAFDGATGPYVQYAATRLGSILRKAVGNPFSGGKTTLTALTEPSEKRLALTIAAFPGVVRRAAAELRPAFVAQWCLDMATRSNEFYRDVKVLESAPEQKAARLRLVAASRTVLERGLSFLGIPVPEEM